MLLVPIEVVCVVCDRRFCCGNCREKHELHTHRTEEIAYHRNASKCDLCKGFSSLAFKLRNDFEFIMHLCQHHLPLQCKKCLTKFSSIDDFTSARKCLHTQLTAVQESKLTRILCAEDNSHDNAMTNLSDGNYITAANGNHSDSDPDSCSNSVSPSYDIETVAQARVRVLQHRKVNRGGTKCCCDQNILDSALSLRNCSSILHTSSVNHTIYRNNSPFETTRKLVRQTSTPMQQNVMVVTSPESIVCSCAISSSMCQVSSIHSSNSSESDTSPNSTKEVNAHQRNAVPPKQRTTVKRMTKTKLATAVTPLRQVMSKSIQRAIREHGPSELLSPKSPLDLRMSPALRRFATSFKASDTELSEESGIGVEIIKRNNRRSSLELKNPLETVYETVNGHDSMLESASETHRNDCKTNNLPTSHFSQHQDASDEATPLTSGRKYNASNKVYDDAIAEVWYTPSENFDKAVPKSEIYTPVLKSSNRTNKRIAIQQCDDSTRENAEVGKQTQETNHTPPKSSRLWSLVSSVFRFVPFKTAEEPVDQNEMSSTDSDSSPFVIKRCASFAGVLRETLLSSPELEVDDSQPKKRRRTSTINGPVNNIASYSYYRHIRGRPPIQRMKNIA